LDTTTLRVVAEGKIDLVNETYDLILRPNPKRPQLLSLELPLGVTGPLSEPEITMGKLLAVRTIGHIAKNTLLYPLKLIAGERLPKDGSDICPCATTAKPDPPKPRWASTNQPTLRLPARSPNLNACAERFVRSIKEEECLGRMILIGEGSRRRAADQFCEHYPRERNHQGVGNRIIEPDFGSGGEGEVQCRERLGGLLRYYYYYRDAA
jgi:hypothetical protein